MKANPIHQYPKLCDCRCGVAWHGTVLATSLRKNVGDMRGKARFALIQPSSNWQTRRNRGFGSGGHFHYRMPVVQSDALTHSRSSNIFCFDVEASTWRRKKGKRGTICSAPRCSSPLLLADPLNYSPPIDHLLPSPFGEKFHGLEIDPAGRATTTLNPSVTPWAQIKANKIIALRASTQQLKHNIWHNKQGATALD